MLYIWEKYFISFESYSCHTIKDHIKFIKPSMSIKVLYIESSIVTRCKASNEK